MSELVQKLAVGSHPVQATLRPKPSVSALKECIDRNYVHIKFTGTRGGTELGVRLDPEACDLNGGDFATGEGRIKLVGGLTLDYVKVRCVADIDLQTFLGEGHLEIAEQEQAG